MRDRVHRELTALLATGGPLYVAPVSVREYLAAPDLANEIADEYRRATPAGQIDGRAMVFTAGPPGAGKSTTLSAHRTTFRVIDPDEIKSLLLARLMDRGLLDGLAHHRLADGGVVRPGEAGWWVHRASTNVADRVRRVSLGMRENFVMEGTLQWEGAPAQFTNELNEAEYEYLEVIDVEVPLHTALAQAKQRWWDGRTDPMTPLGGRFVAPEFIQRCYTPGTDSVSICAQHARALFEGARDLLIAARLRTVVCDNKGVARTATIDEAGATEWVIPEIGPSLGFGAACIRCGRSLTSQRSVEIGLGEECRRR